MTDGTTKRVLLNHYVQPDAVLRPAPSEQDDRARAFSFSAHDAAAAAASPAGTPAGKLTFALRFKAEAAAGACGTPPRWLRARAARASRPPTRPLAACSRRRRV